MLGDLIVKFNDGVTRISEINEQIKTYTRNRKGFSQNLVERLNGIKKNIRDLEEYVDYLTGRIDNLQRDLSTNTEEQRKLQDSLQQIDTERANTIKALQDSEARLRAATTEIEQKDRDIAALKVQTQQRYEQIQELQQQIQQQQQLQQQLQQQIQQLQQQIQKLQQQPPGQQPPGQQPPGQQPNVQQLTTDLQNAQQALVIAQKERDDAQQALATAQADLINAQQALATAQEERDNALNGRTDLENNNIRLQETVDKLTKEIEGRQRESDMLNQENLMLREEISKATNSINRTIDQLNASMTEMERETTESPEIQTLFGEIQESLKKVNDSMNRMGFTPGSFSPSARLPPGGGVSLAPNTPLTDTSQITPGSFSPSVRLPPGGGVSLAPNTQLTDTSQITIKDNNGSDINISYLDFKQFMDSKIRDLQRFPETKQRYQDILNKINARKISTAEALNQALRSERIVLTENHKGFRGGKNKKIKNKKTKKQIKKGGYIYNLNTKRRTLTSSRRNTSSRRTPSKNSSSRRSSRRSSSM